MYNLREEMKRVVNKLGFSQIVRSRVAMRKAARLVSDGVPVCRVMRAVGYAPNTADHKSTEMTHHPAFIRAKNELQDALTRRNPKILDKTARVIDDGLDAVKYVAALGCHEPDQDARGHNADRVIKIFEPPGDGADVSLKINIFQLVEQARTERGLPI